MPGMPSATLPGAARRVADGQVVNPLCPLHLQRDHCGQRQGYGFAPVLTRSPTKAGAAACGLALDTALR